MKTFFKACLLALLLCLFALPVNAKSAYALSTNASDVRSIANSYLLDFVNYGYDNKVTVDRRAGTYGERLAAGVIQNNLQNLEETMPSGDRFNRLTPKQNSSTKNGVQTFEFVNDKTGKKESSQNIIYTLKGAKSDKKVVLTTVYDNYFEGYLSQKDQIVTPGEEYSEGINASAASVACLLTLAKVLPVNLLDFDVEFVFLGAGYSGNSGAKYYSQTLSKSERDNIIVSIDISNIALGEDIYYYSGNFGGNNFYQNFGLTKYSPSISGSSQIADTMLGYTNAGYSGTTSVLEGNGYNILHIFAGAYNSGVVSGLREFTGIENITNTKNDSLDYITANHGAVVSKNMEKAINSLCSILASENLVAELSKSAATAAYNFFSGKYVAIIMIVTVLLLLIVSTIYQYFLNKGAYKFILDNGIINISLKIDDESSDNKIDK